jgi:hypothetical protein
VPQDFGRPLPVALPARNRPSGMLTSIPHRVGLCPRRKGRHRSEHSIPRSDGCRCTRSHCCSSGGGSGPRGKREACGHREAGRRSRRGIISAGGLAGAQHFRAHTRQRHCGANDGRRSRNHRVGKGPCGGGSGADREGSMVLVQTFSE